MGSEMCIRDRYQAIHDGGPTNDLIAIKYLEALQGIADGRATKIYLPLDTGSVYGSIAGIAELFKGAGEDGVDEGPRPRRSNPVPPAVVPPPVPPVPPMPVTPVPHDPLGDVPQV